MGSLVLSTPEHLQGDHVTDEFPAVKWFESGRAWPGQDVDN